MLVLFFAAFYFWNFPFHAIVNILLKSLLLGILYLFVALKLKIAPESNAVWYSFVSFITGKSKK